MSIVTNQRVYYSSLETVEAYIITILVTFQRKVTQLGMYAAKANVNNPKIFQLYVLQALTIYIYIKTWQLIHNYIKIIAKL